MRDLIDDHAETRVAIDVDHSDAIVESCLGRRLDMFIVVVVFLDELHLLLGQLVAQTDLRRVALAMEWRNLINLREAYTWALADAPPRGASLVFDLDFGGNNLL